MNIIADENIPFAEKLFSKLGNISLLSGRHIKHADLVNADVLLTRSVTKVNENLLQGHDITFVGTCTIGTDHIDQAYLAENNIGFSSAPGCNAYGVVQYDMCALAYLNKLDASLRYAVIGCGNVGGRVYRHLKALGFNCIGVDPHLSTHDIPDLKPFEAIYDCDVICMHTPLIKDGDYPTESMIAYRELTRMKPGTLLLNAGRGECIDNDALLQYLRDSKDVEVVLDVWASEPNMNVDLFPYVKIGTPHIAGYSFEGRVNGSTMIFEALARYLGKTEAWIDECLSMLRADVFGPRQTIKADTLRQLVTATYDIRADHDDLRVGLPDLPASFDVLRKNYRKRREFTHFSCLPIMSEFDTGINICEALGFGAASALKSL